MFHFFSANSASEMSDYHLFLDMSQSWNIFPISPNTVKSTSYNQILKYYRIVTYKKTPQVTNQLSTVLRQLPTIHLKSQTTSLRMCKCIFVNSLCWPAHSHCATCLQLTFFLTFYSNGRNSPLCYRCKAGRTPKRSWTAQEEPKATSERSVRSVWACPASEVRCFSWWSRDLDSVRSTPLSRMLSLPESGCAGIWWCLRLKK